MVYCVRCPLRSHALLAVLLLTPLLPQVARADDPPAAPKPRQDLFDFGKDPLKPTVKRPDPATQPAQIGSAEVKVTSTHLDYVQLGPSTEHGPAPAGAEVANSQDKFLIIRLEIRNTSADKPLSYHTFALPFGPAGRETYASLAMGRKMLTLVNFGEQEPVGLTRAAEIGPGKVISDVLVFMAVPELEGKGAAGTPLKLTLPAEQLGVTGKPVRVDLDLANVQKRE
jgi:hypothetical protein